MTTTVSLYNNLGVQIGIATDGVAKTLLGAVLSTNLAFDVSGKVVIGWVISGAYTALADVVSAATQKQAAADSAACDARVSAAASAPPTSSTPSPKIVLRQTKKTGVPLGGIIVTVASSAYDDAGTLNVMLKVEAS